MTNQQIRFVMRSGQRRSTPYVHIYAAAAANSARPQVACVVGKNVHRQAVVRHRYQRLLRAAARSLAAHVTPACDMVWVAKPEITQVKKLAELEQTLQIYLDEISPS